MRDDAKTLTIVKGVIAILLLLCLVDAPYGYYQAMRTLASFGFAFLAYQYYQLGDKKNAVVFAALLVVFQPLFKIAFGRELWNIIDVIVAVYLLHSVYGWLSSSGIIGKYKMNSNKKATMRSEPKSIDDKANDIRLKW